MPARRKAKASNQDGSVKEVEESMEVSVDNKESNLIDNVSGGSAPSSQSEPPAKKKKARKGKDVVESETSADVKAVEEPSKTVDEPASLPPKKPSKNQANKNATNEEPAKKPTGKAQGTKKVNKSKKNPIGEAVERVLRSNSKIKNGAST